MNALAIDSASPCMEIAAQSGAAHAAVSLGIGMKQSQEILPAIGYVLEKAGITAAELDYAALCAGPGTFTGLRLAFSALKALTIAYGVPVYGVPSLDAYAEPYKNFGMPVVSVIDAKKDQFFAAIYKGGAPFLPAEDTSAARIADSLTHLGADSDGIIVVGPDAAVFADALRAERPTLPLRVPASQPSATGALFRIAEGMIAQKKEPLKDYDGPVYLRKSEAELNLGGRASTQQL